MAVTGIVQRSTGKMLFNSACLFGFGKGGGLIHVGGNFTDGVQTGSQGNGADTTEDTLFTYTLPANALDILGRELSIFAYGNVGATSATKTVKVYFGSQSVTVGAYTTTQTGNWQAMMTVLKTGSSEQQIVAQIDAMGLAAADTRSLTLTTNAAEDDTAAITIKVTGQSSVATANLVVCNGLIISGFN